VGQSQKFENLTIKIKKLHKNAKLPVKINRTDVGFDVIAVGYTRITGWSKAVLPLGIAVAIPEDYYIKIDERSGFASRESVFIKGGVVDPGYRGEVKVVLANHGPEPINIELGDKIAQFVLHHRIDATFEWADNLDDTERGEKGFGSSDSAEEK